MTHKDPDKYREYMNDYMKKRYAKRRTKAIDQLGGCCVICGSSENLEFDHIDEHTKDTSIAKASSFSEKRWQEELSKCQLLCHTCHVAKHASQAQCGTPQRYWRGCRCDLCKSANAEQSRNYKRKRKEHQSRKLSE